MAITAFSGPVIAFGQSPYAGLEYNPNIGPSQFFGGTGILDPRTPYTYQPGNHGSAISAGFLGTTNIPTLNAVPYTAAAAAIVASANPAGATLTLVSAASATTGISTTTTMVRADTGAVDAGPLVILDGYSSFTASIAGTVMTVTANSTMPIAIGMVLLTAAGTGTLATGVKVLAFGTGTGGAGTYTVSASQTIGSGTITAGITTPTDCLVRFGSSGSGGPGAISIWNPMTAVGRAVSVTAASGATYATATISGYDVYGYPMSEAITISAGSAVNGKKAFKYVKSVVLSGGTADTTHAYSVGTADVFGFPLRSDTFGDVLINSAASLTAVTLITAASNYVASVQTAATTTTGDVRGTFAATSSTGANRIIVRQTPPVYNVGSIAGLFGTTQA